MADRERQAGRVALITGAARRLGAAIAERLHDEGCSVIIHYRSARAEAEALRARLDARRPGTVWLVDADLGRIDELPDLVERAVGLAGGLGVLVNNASSFYPTPLGTVSLDQWHDLLSTNLTGPFFLAQAAGPYLRDSAGAIVNIIDIHAERMLQGYPVYSIAKAGLAAMTKSLAKELAPDVRVNGVSPGAILWPEAQAGDSEDKERVLERILLRKMGRTEDIARAVSYLALEAQYVTGQILAVDGGRTLFS